MNHEVTLNCTDCHFGPLSAIHADDTGHEADGMLAAMMALHAEQYPDHAVSMSVETMTAAAIRRADEAERDAATARGVAERSAERERSRRHRTGRATSSVSIYPWLG